MTMFTIILNDVVNNLGKETWKYFTDNNTIKCIFIVSKSNLWHVMKITWKFVPVGPIDDKSLVQAVAWCRIGSKPLPEQMMTYFNGGGLWVSDYI